MLVFPSPMRILLFFIVPLVFFGGGVLFASLIWGKYKHLCEALWHRVDKHIESEENLRQELEALRQEHAGQSATCQTLEEELVHLGRERESLQERLEEAAHREDTRTALEGQLATAKATLEDRDQQCRRQESDLKTLREEQSRQKDKLAAAENRAQQLAEEKGEVLSLVAKLQSRLEQVDQLRDQQQDAIRLQQRTERRERTRRRRAEQAVADEEESPSKRRRLAIRRSRGSRGAALGHHAGSAPLNPSTNGQPHSPATTPSAPVETPSRDHASPAKEAAPSVTQRVMDRLFPSASAPKKRRERW